MQNIFDPCIKRIITQTFSNNVYKNLFLKKTTALISLTLKALRNLEELSLNNLTSP